MAGYFDCVSLGVQSLPDFARPLEIFKVIRESGARSRLDAAAQLTPLVGRQDRNRQTDGVLGTSRARHAPSRADTRRGRHRQVTFAAHPETAVVRPVARDLRVTLFPGIQPVAFPSADGDVRNCYRLANDDTPETKFGKVVAPMCKTHYPASIGAWCRPDARPTAFLAAGRAHRPPIYRRKN